MGKAKCSECGVLAGIDIDTRRLVEVEKVFRDKGTPPIKYVAGRNPYICQETVPICFVQANDLKHEAIGFGGKEAPDIVAIGHIINKGRKYSSFTKWQQGFTPKEHREMIDRKWKKNGIG